MDLTPTDLASQTHMTHEMGFAEHACALNLIRAGIISVVVNHFFRMETDGKWLRDCF